MKQFALFFAVFASVALATSGQQPGQPQLIPASPTPYGDRGPAPGDDLPKFDLDFRTGDVSELIEAVCQELLKVDKDAFLNVVIPTEYRHHPMPPLKMRNVNVSQLFRALEMASQRTMDDERFPGRQEMTSSRYGFQTAGPAMRDSIWHFYVKTPIQESQKKVLRYFQLAPYLSQYTMDDIGKAIQSGWNLLEEEHETKLNFHKETKLLIAVGPPHQLETISMVLQQLGLGLTNSPSAGAAHKPIQAVPMPKDAPKL